MRSLLWSSVFFHLALFFLSLFCEGFIRHRPGNPPSPESGKNNTNKHKHFRRDGVRDKQEPSLGQMGPLPGTKWDPSLGQTGLSLFKSTVKSPFCPVCPWDGWGFVPGTIVPQRPSEKCLCVFCLLVFVLPTESASPSPPQWSIWHRKRVKSSTSMSNRC